MATSHSSPSQPPDSDAADGGQALRSEQEAQPEQDAGAEQAEEASPPSYEEARDELVEVVRRLETGGTTLEESLTLWERGEELARICQSWLRGARERLEQAERRDADENAAGGDESEGR